ncbi:Multiple antibiotic resistance protein marR [Delftia tsuruhatensis]|uniref:MarR family winged helix-turn-helix transcriptional regulator n=1 Tax=Delftia tsuruhatensis TaxID=180282 RepID=UPI001E7864FE|nr:MarR family winged helix-turn-helix transcriptional regulator [Delftia tsuruhatensis]CAB5686365.1 Multiple antibiotic resistance protein marR [Delftia tsuruhatensis]CAC9690399.1 Multiple antibiotic resistance protein marR [Delftia tsuruhatensis]
MRSDPDLFPMPQGCTNHRVRQLMRGIGQVYDAHLAASGLRITQYSLLSHVLASSPVRPVDLARRMRMDASTLTRNLKPLVDAGWVRMGPGEDQRSRLVHITEEGRARREQAKQCWKTAQNEINARLGAQRVAALHGLIDECLELLDVPAQD